MLLSALVWSVFFFLHSLLASNSVKSTVQKASPSLFRFYRLAYNLIATLTLAATWLYHRSLPSEPLVTDDLLMPVIKTIGWTLMALGALFIWISFRNYDKNEFLGFRQIEKPEEKNTLQTKGLNRWVRHPLYTGTLVFVLGWFASTPTTTQLAATLVVIAYLFIGAWLEERKLIKEFGQAYRDYKKKVPMIIPLPKR